MSVTALLTTLLLSAPGPAQESSGLYPDEVLSPPGGPEVVVFRDVSPEVVSLRLSVHLEEVPGEGGAGELIRIQAEDRMRTIANRIGAKAEVHRTPRVLVYQVTGAAADLDFLGWVLREGLKPPAHEDFEAARRLLRVEGDRAAETPQGLLSLRLHRALAPGVPPRYGSQDELDRMTPSRLVGIWERSHRRDGARLVVAGRIPAELVLALTVDLRLPSGEPTAGPPEPEEVRASPTSPEVIRHWTAAAYPISEWDDAVGLVVGSWLGEVVRTEEGDFELGADIWDVGGRRALVVSGAAYSRSRQPMMNRTNALLGDAAAALTEDTVRRIREDLRTELLASTQSAWGLAELAGQAWDAGHGPEGLARLLDALEHVNYGEVRRLLEATAAATPIREQLDP